MTKHVRQFMKDAHQLIISRTDKTFAYLLAAEWMVAIIVALVISPLTWSGEYSKTHIHVYLAVFFGAVITLFPIYNIWRHPGHYINRYYAAISQSMFSILFIHLTGGRIETHFHIFVSLAFMAFYLDWKVLLIPTIITVIDHYAGGYYFPMSVYGTNYATYLRATEHAAWVVFEDVVLFYMISTGQELLRNTAAKHKELEDSLSLVEEKVIARTKDLEESKHVILAQQQQILSVSKMSALGEMAGGIAHEINNPLAVISMFSDQIATELESEVVDKESLLDITKQIDSTVERIAKIIASLRSFALDGALAPMHSVNVKKMIDDTLIFCSEKIKKNNINLTISDFNPDLSFMGRDTEISQVFLNLLNNSTDAISEHKNKWIKVEVLDLGNMIRLSVTDCGNGISEELAQKIFDPFFTTKDVGKGTGMGLSISAGIVKAHQGQFYVDHSKTNTTFNIDLPKENK